MRKNIKIKMDDDVADSFRRDFVFYLLTCGRRSLVSGTQNDIVSELNYPVRNNSD